MNENQENNQDPVAEMLGHVLHEVEKNANRIVRLFADEDKALAKLTSDDARELATETKKRMIEAVQKGDYDTFAFCLAILAHAGVIKGGRDKWKQLPMITDLVWRGMRDALKSEIAESVAEFLKEFE